MKNLLKQEKGVSLISLAAAIIILGIITSILVYSAKDTKHVEALTNMYTDIENLTDKISAYYATYGKIPASEQEQIDITKNEEDFNNIKDALGENDGDVFYVIDLSALENLTLNYGKGYEDNYEDSEGKLTTKDLYIINEKSHNIFYLDGIKIDDKTYYTNQDKDSEKIDLRYVDGIKIPDGYTYEGRDTSNNITISKKETEDNVQNPSFTWKKLNNKITDVPDDCKYDENGLELDDTKKQEFLESANAYEGYYQGNGTNNANQVIYLSLNEENESSWSPVYENDGTYVDEDGKTAYIPQGFKVSKLPTMNKISKGLVIKDSSGNEKINGNEFVWIPVPKEVLKIADKTGETIDAVTSEEVEKALIEYTKDYRNDSSKDLWYDGCGILNKNDYANLKNKAMQSIKEHEGFYISRYEAGIEENRTAEGNVTEAPLSKQGTVENPIYPYTYITCKQAQTIASKLSTEKSYTSSLMFGVQWNLVLKHIEVKEGTDATKLATIQSALRSDSTGWGNYYNATFEINRGKYAKYGALTAWYNYNNESGLANCVTYANGKSTKLSASSNSNSILLTTGASDACKKMNIYDLAGNVSEWTLEYTAVINSSCALRGGTFASNGSNIPAAYRFSSYTTYSSGNIGFRPSLFK